ncbi:MAG: type II secretion system protein J [Chthoniobacteraceae bacterium]
MFFNTLHRLRGYNLLELLVAMAIVSALILLFNQIVSSASITTRLSQTRIDAVTQAQQVMDRMMLDFAQMPIRKDIDYRFAKASGNDSFSFYSATDGLYPSTASVSSTTSRTLSIIGYKIATATVGSGTGPVLMRGARQLDWASNGPACSAMCYTLVDGTGGQTQKLEDGSSNTLPSVNSTASNYQVLGDLIFRMEICFLVSTSSTAASVLQTTLPDNISKLSAIVVAVAVLDEKSRYGITDYSKLISAFGDAEDGKDILSVWSPVLSNSGFASKAGVSPRAAQTVRIFQRYFYLK